MSGGESFTCELKSLDATMFKYYKHDPNFQIQRLPFAVRRIHSNRSDQKSAKTLKYLLRRMMLRDFV